MSLEPYRYRSVTPESTAARSPGYYSRHSRHSSRSSIWSSPGSNDTRATTPSRSPHSPVRQLGPVLIPKVRTVDQGLEPDLRRPTHSHRRALSTFSNPPEHAATTRSGARPGYHRSTTSPPECSSLLTPTSISRSSTPLASRAVSSHGRSTSTTGIDAATLRRYANPNYRSYPVYTTRSQYTSAVVPEIADFVSPEITFTSSTAYRDLTPELECSYGPTTTMTAYLTSPNPSVCLVSRLTIGTGIHTHCWWDIRNLRSWTDFSLRTISSIPGFTSSPFSSTGLLSIPIEAAALPLPPYTPTALEPPNERALQDIITKHYATKINAATKTSQGQHRHMTMLPQHTSEYGPHFLSYYTTTSSSSSSPPTLSNRPRLIGLVKPYELWNTGMRHGKGQTHVKYLTHLSHLHRAMRDHNTRYGYLITEIELVCVRMGTTPPEDGAPYFGFLELSAPIPLSKTDGLTACLALWYLHMLCADVPLDGQCGWKVDIGPPVACTRQKVWVGGRDPEMQSVGVQESRVAKTRRGWVWPGDAFHRGKEGKGPKRG